MKATAILNTKAVAYGAVILVGGVLLYFLVKKVGKAAADTIEEVSTSVARVNEGTPYEGAGVVGTLGNITNQASGGVLADFGSWIGSTLYDWTHEDYTP